MNHQALSSFIWSVADLLRGDYKPPFGVEWKKVEKEVRKEHEQQGFNGRFGPGLPRVSDGSMLFLLHLTKRSHWSLIRFDTGVATSPDVWSGTKQA